MWRGSATFVRLLRQFREDRHLLCGVLAQGGLMKRHTAWVAAVGMTVACGGAIDAATDPAEKVARINARHALRRRDGPLSSQHRLEESDGNVLGARDVRFLSTQQPRLSQPPAGRSLRQGPELSAYSDRPG